MLRSTYPCALTGIAAFTLAATGTMAQLAGAVHDYTRDALTQLIAAGARPDMVAIANETTPGMLIHRCDARGVPKEPKGTAGANPVDGSTSNWSNLGALTPPEKGC